MTNHENFIIENKPIKKVVDIKILTKILTLDEFHFATTIIKGITNNEICLSRIFKANLKSGDKIVKVMKTPIAIRKGNNTFLLEYKFTFLFFSKIRARANKTYRKGTYFSPRNIPMKGNIPKRKGSVPFLIILIIPK
ncbi:hypothetical protein [Maribacter aquivivus]|uniref:hypothetical protein n=1 Tax=Maribacter aquivivus TaxID=228958 RepID=UPI0024934FAC|nr:hypothetical protein [Maribacter aquivivus]